MVYGELSVRRDFIGKPLEENQSTWRRKQRRTDSSPSTEMKEIAIIGAGSWGTVWALVAARAGNRIRLWAHSAEVATFLRRERENKIYLPGFTLPTAIASTDDLAEALAGAEIVLTVMPSHVCREI